MTTSAAIEQFDKSINEKTEAIERVWHVLEAYKEDKIPFKIDEGLYLGSIGTAVNKAALKDHNVTHILTVAGRIPPPHPNDFVYKIIDVADKFDEDLKQHFSECFDFIDEAKRLGGAVLVHCFAGRSRSVTIVMAYLMRNRGMSLFQALQHVTIIRPEARPNPGFVSQLQEFEKSLQDASKSR